MATTIQEVMAKQMEAMTELTEAIARGEQVDYGRLANLQAMTVVMLGHAFVAGVIESEETTNAAIKGLLEGD